MVDRTAILIFGEDDNDISAVRELVLALRPEHRLVKKRRSPPVLVKGIEEAKARKNLKDIASVVRAEQRRGQRCTVVAHRDSDAIEPAHEMLAKQIEDGLTREGIDQVVAAVAAWEIEAWWFLWPDAVAAVNGRWRKLKPPQPQVGMIPNAKEALRQVLRPRTKGKRPPDYKESDSPKIASKVRELNLIDKPSASSGSFDRFAEKVRRFKL